MTEKIKERDWNVASILRLAINLFNNQSLAPRDGKTYCNIAVLKFIDELTHEHFSLMLANDIYDRLATDPLWGQTGPAGAEWAALEGRLVIAAQKNEPHGHVVVCLPMVGTYSGKWKITVPLCLNIGAKNSIGRGVNWAFAQMPDFFVYQNDLF